MLLRQLPYRDADRVFWIWSDQPGRDRTPFNVPDFIDYRNGTRTLAGFAGFFAYRRVGRDEDSVGAVRNHQSRAARLMRLIFGSPAQP